MPQSSDEKTPKTAEEMLFEIPNLDNTDQISVYFNTAIQSIWSAMVSMVETQRRMSKQLQTLRHNYNRLLDTTEAMLAVINSPQENPLYHQKQSNAAQILRENSNSVGQNIIPEQSTSPKVSVPKFNIPKIPKGDGASANMKNLWTRK